MLPLKYSNVSALLKYTAQ